MIETAKEFINSIQNNQLLVLLFSGGIIWTVFSNLQLLFNAIIKGILSCISFTINSVTVSEYDTPVLNLKITKVLSESKVLWERHTELQPSSSEYTETHLTNSAYGRSYRLIFGHFAILDRTYSTQSTKVVTSLSLRVFFANRKKFIKKLMQEVENCSLTGNRETISIKMNKGLETEKQKRSIESVYSNDGTPERILSDIRSFINNKEIYSTGNSPYKFVALLTGSPGTGKTSVIHAIASELGMGVRFINTDDEDFEDVARAMTKNDEYNQISGKNIIVIEDVDCMSMNATTKRKLPNEVPDDFESSSTSRKRDFIRLMSQCDDNPTTISLTSILNLLDGIITPSGTIVFLTSNNPEKLDSALLRDGRIDAKYEFTNFNKETSNKLIKDYLGFEIDNIKDNIIPSSIQRDVLKVKIGRMTKEELVEKYSI